MLSEYIEQLATDLLVNLTVPMSQTRVGVTTFIEFSPDLSSITLLGNMMAESFIFELQQNGIQVIDYKVEDEIKMAEHGEFIFTRQPSKLTMQHSMDYVLSGTFMYNKRGIEVYARIVEFNTKRVVSSAKRVIPYFVLDGIIPSSEKHHVVYN
jgi:TolB-like protein